MVWARTFVAIDAADFKDLFVAAGHQTFLPKLAHGDTEIDIDIEIVVMGLERVGFGAAGSHFERRRFNFEKAVALQEIARHFPKERFLEEDIAQFGIEQEVEIALAEKLVFILKAIPGIRNRAQSFGEQLPFLNHETFLALMGQEGIAPHFQEIGNVDQLQEHLIGLDS